MLKAKNQYAKRAAKLGPKENAGSRHMEPTFYKIYKN